MKTKYQILAVYTINGKSCECLCDTPTKTGRQMITYDESIAQQRVAELKSQGIDARYEKVAPEDAWWEDENWIG